MSDRRQNTARPGASLPEREIPFLSLSLNGDSLYATVRHMPQSKRKPVAAKAPLIPTRRTLETELRRLLDVYSIHMVLHALVEECYRRAAAGGMAQGLQPVTINEIAWREAGRCISWTEDMIARLAV